MTKVGAFMDTHSSELFNQKFHFVPIHGYFIWETRMYFYSVNHKPAITERRAICSEIYAICAGIYAIFSDIYAR